MTPSTPRIGAAAVSNPTPTLTAANFPALLDLLRVRLPSWTEWVELERDDYVAQAGGRLGDLRVFIYLPLVHRGPYRWPYLEVMGSEDKVRATTIEGIVDEIISMLCDVRGRALDKAAEKAKLAATIGASLDGASPASEPPP